MDEKNILKILGRRLKDKREKASLTQAQLAEMIGLSTNFIGMVERGERNTKFVNVYRLVYALNSTLEDFFKGI